MVYARDVRVEAARIEMAGDCRVRRAAPQCGRGRELARAISPRSARDQPGTIGTQQPVWQ